MSMARREFIKQSAAAAAAKASAEAARAESTSASELSGKQSAALIDAAQRVVDGTGDIAELRAALTDLEAASP